MMDKRSLALVFCFFLATSSIGFILGLSFRLANASPQFLSVTISPQNVKLGVGQVQEFMATVANRDASYLPYSYSWTDSSGTVLGIGQTLSFSFKEATNGTVLSVTVVSARGNQGYASVWVADPYTSANVYIDALQTGWVVQPDGLGWYGAFNNGKLTYSSTSAGTTVNNVITVLSSGGYFRLTSGTFTLGGVPIMFDDGNYMTEEWTMEGAGQGTIISETTSNKNCIVITGDTRVTLRDFQVSVGSSAGYGLIADRWHRGSMVNVHFEGGNSAYNLVKLTNFGDLTWDHVKLVSSTSGCVPLLLLSNVTGYNCGNSHFDWLEISSTSADGLVLNATSTSINNLNVFTWLGVGNMGTAGSTRGIVIGRNTNYNTFLFTDSELFGTAAYIGGTSDGACGLNTFSGGYFTGSTYGIHVGYYTISNKITDVTMAGGTQDLYDEQDYRPPNIYTDIYLINSKLSASGGSPGPRFRGDAGNSRFFETYTAFTNIANGTYVPILGGNGIMIATPTVGLVTLTTQGYAWIGAMNTTHALIYSSKATGNSGTVYLGYKPP